MRYILLIVSLFLLKPTHAQESLGEGKNIDSILNKVHSKLRSLKTVSYDLERELSYSTEGYHHVSKWTCFFDFESNSVSAPFRYQISDQAFKYFYNGTEKFELNLADKTIQISENPEVKSLGSSSFFYNSLITLKNVLPLIIQDKTSIISLSDTLINNLSYKLITVNLGKRRIQNLGQGFDEMTTAYSFIYQIVLDADQYLPLEIIQLNDLNNDFIKTSFTNYALEPISPSENSWYYSTYLDEYGIKGNVDALKTSLVGSFAPNWRLKRLRGKGESLSLSELKGNVVFIDFWIKNCGPCIQSVPSLNELTDKFKDEGVKLLSINSYDSKEDIEKFHERHKVKYPVLLNGKEVAEDYHVNAFPTFFILDKSGKIIYSHIGFKESLIQEIEGIIYKSL